MDGRPSRDGMDLAVGEAVATRRGVEASAASVVFAFGSACIFAGGVGGVAQPMIGTAQVPASTEPISARIYHAQEYNPVVNN